MRKNLAMFLVGISLLGFCFSAKAYSVQAATYENQAVVRFYSSEEEEKTTSESPENQGTLPQTGSTFSWLGTIGFTLVLLFLWLKRRSKKMSKEKNLRKE